MDHYDFFKKDAKIGGKKKTNKKSDFIFGIYIFSIAHILYKHRRL